MCLSQLIAYQFTYHFLKPDIINNRVIMTDCFNNPKAFEPNIAIKPVSLLLPYNQRAINMQVSYSNPVILDGTYDIDPTYPSGRISVTPPNAEKRFSPHYQIDKFYPELNSSQKFTMQYKNGHPILVSEIFPVQYNPITKKIQYYQNISLNIQTDYFHNDLYKHNTQISKQIAGVINNTDLLVSFPDTPKAIDDYDYLIITTNDYQNNFSSFINFNLQRGLETQLVTKEYITSNITGNDTQDKLRNYIKQEYLTHNITYVLLAGDDELLPHRGFRSQINDYGTDYYDELDIPADMYFACLDGTWKNEGSQYYGESGSEDLLYEVYVARFAIDSNAELTNVINKTIAYSTAPVNATIQNNLLVGEHLWGPPEFPSDIYGQMYMDEFLGQCTTNNYATSGFNSTWTTSTLYDNTIPWDGNTLITKIATDKPSWLDHLGHSNVTYNMQLSNPDVNATNFTNNGTNANYFVIYSQGCYSGSFDNRTTNVGSYSQQDCIGEKFTTITTGAVAYVGNSRYGLGSPYNTDGSGQVYHRYFHDALFNKNYHSIEMMNAYSKEITAPLILEEDITLAPYYGQCKWIAYCVNVLGDPALSIWTAQAQNLTPTASDSLYLNTDYVIQTEPFARILIHNESNILIFSGMADSLGFYNLNQDHPDFNQILTQNPNDIYLLNIKAENYYPYQKALQVAGSPIADQTIIPQISKIVNYPNPFNPSTQISFTLSSPANINLTIYNLKGQKVKSLLTDKLNSGNHSVKWDGKDDNNLAVGSGVYFYRLQYNNHSVSRKMILIK